jgi:hypothetical protein
MSCNFNSQNVGHLAAVKCGISAAAGKASYVAGTMAGGLARASDAVNYSVGAALAPASNRVLAAVDRPAVAAAKLAPALAMAVAATRFQVRTAIGPNQMPAIGAAVTLRPSQELFRNARGVMKTTKRVKTGMTIGAVAASTVAGLSLKEKSRELVQERRSGLFFKSNVKVTFAKSRLTGLLNRLDLAGSHRLGQNVVSSEGDLVTAQGKAWHRGAIVFKTPQGERTMTHLQSMTLPATHYYFDRALTDEEIAGIVSDQKGFKPPQMAGYIGEVNAMEGLAPAWAQTKHAMIRTRLYFPTQVQGWAKTEVSTSNAKAEKVSARPKRVQRAGQPAKAKQVPIKEI